MGVKLLETLIDGRNILEEWSFSNKHIVVDGGLYYHLYNQSGLDKEKGGDYPAFQVEVEEFFRALKGCKIIPYVILDGAKMPKARQEAEPQKPNPSGAKIPPLIKDVFIQILQKNQIDFEQCLGSADLRIAQRANELRCPVLSNDSDFCIHDVTEGYVPFKHFKLKCNQNQKIAAKIYRISKFCSHFELTPGVMPVFAALVKNGNIENISNLEEILGSLRGRHNNNTEELLRELGVRDVPLHMATIDAYRVEPKSPANLPPWVSEAVQKGNLTSFAISVLNDNVPPLDGPSGDIRQAFCGLLKGTPPRK